MDAIGQWKDPSSWSYTGFADATSIEHPTLEEVTARLQLLSEDTLAFFRDYSCLESDRDRAQSKAHLEISKWKAKYNQVEATTPPPYPLLDLNSIWGKESSQSGPLPKIGEETLEILVPDRRVTLPEFLQKLAKDDEARSQKGESPDARKRKPARTASRKKGAGKKPEMARVKNLSQQRNSNLEAYMSPASVSVGACDLERLFSAAVFNETGSRGNLLMERPPLHTQRFAIPDQNVELNKTKAEVLGTGENTKSLVKLRLQSVFISGADGIGNPAIGQLGVKKIGAKQTAARELADWKRLGKILKIAMEFDQ
jgi:hypothetical protein